MTASTNVVGTSQGTELLERSVLRPPRGLSYIAGLHNYTGVNRNMVESSGESFFYNFNHNGRGTHLPRIWASFRVSRENQDLDLIMPTHVCVNPEVHVYKK